jgi:hypothetical protein
MPADWEDMGRNNPNRAARVFEKLIKTLSFVIKQDKIYPSRPKLHRRLEAIEKAARLLMDELSELRINALLRDGDERIENENELYHRLRDLAARAARVRARNPRTQGRGKLYPKAAIGPNPMELCALMVGLAYCEGLGRWPGKRNAKAHQNCEALWKAAGGPRRLGWGKSGSATVAVWHHHLKAAQNYRPPHPAGMHIQQHILSPDIGRPTKRGSQLASLIYDHPRSRRAVARQAHASVEKEGVGRKKD